MKILGIDQGTTSTRALLGDDHDGLKIIHTIEHSQIYPFEGWVEHDAEVLLNNIKSCINSAGKVDAIGIDNQGESCLAWDAITGEALSPVIVWQDGRTLDRVEALKAQNLDVETFARAGLPLDPYFSATKLNWLLENLSAVKEAHIKGRLRLGTTDAFFLDRLSGKFVTDVTTASRTSLMNIKTLNWDPVLCEIFSVPIECLPQIVTTTGDFGAFKTESGFAPITASVVDQQAALYGFGCRQKGQAKMTFGTGAFALSLTGDEIINRPELGLLPTIAWQKSGEQPVYALEGGVYTASSALNWARSLGLFSEFAEINHFDNGPAIDSGLIFVPALAGLGCPYWDAASRGTWLGLSLDHKPQQLVQAIIEGVAFRAAEVFSAMGSCTPLSNRLLVDGGMSKNPYFIQILANAIGQEIKPALMPELTGQGTIELAASFLGNFEFEAPNFGSNLPQKSSKKNSSQTRLEQFKKAVSIVQQWP